MKVYVTPDQFSWLQGAMQRADNSGDPAEVDQIIGQLCIFALSNGSEDFYPSLVRETPTEIEVLYNRTRTGRQPPTT
jgi:hypothetical protein